MDSYQNQGGEVMNKKLVLAAALVFGVAGLMLAQGTVKAQDAAMNSDAAPAMNADNAAAPAAQ